MATSGNGIARQLFAGVADGYDQWAEIFSIFQYARWRQALLREVGPSPGERILDISTGTGAVALDLARLGCRVTGLDISRPMLRQATARVRRSNLTRRVDFVEGRAEDLPFPARTFDAITFTFLLRYVEDPAVPVRDMARVLRSGGRVAMLEFGVPGSPIIRPLWSLYAHVLLPRLTRAAPNGWTRVGFFLGDSIESFHQSYPLPRLREDWSAAGLGSLRVRSLSLGGAFVVSGVME